MQNNIKTTTTCKICKDPIKTDGLVEEDQHRLLEVGICTGCDHWMLQWQDRDSVLVGRISGQHYRIGNPNAHAKDNGMAGRKVIIEFFDGRVVETSNLWHQGSIPTQFKFALPDNAIFRR